MATSDFVLPTALDLSATFFVGLSGALVGVRRGYDIVGIFFVAFLAAVGGALLRDGIFIQDGVLIIVKDPRYVMLIGLATVVGAFFRNNLHRFGRLVSIMDAIGLAAYAVWGATKAMNADISPPGAILVGVVNAVGGGLLRDVCSREEPMIFRPGEFYALVAFVGSSVYVGLVHFEVMKFAHAAYLCIGLMLLARFLTIALNWKTKSFAALHSVPDAAAVAPSVDDVADVVGK